MDLHFAEAGGYLVVSMGGEIDHHAAAETRDKIDKRFEVSGRRCMIMDFAGVTFMDSAGVGLVIGRYKNAQARGGRLYVTGLSGALKKMFELTGLKKLVDCRERPEDIYKGVERNV